jgi:Fe2+ or Zn2+ uptake regulation protein
MQLGCVIIIFMNTQASRIPEKSSPARNTLVRRMLLALFESADHPLTAREICVALAQRDLRVNKTTIYRQLDTLSDQGYIAELSLGTDGKRYEINQGCAHPHLLCRQCGRIECLPVAKEFIDQQRSIAEEHGFTAERCSLEFYGVCNVCQKGITR